MNMPRKACIQAPGVLHHIIICGIERQPIFKDSLDYENFLKRLGNLLTATPSSCYAWARMTGAIHLQRNAGDGERDGAVSKLAGRGRTGPAK